MKRGLFIVVEGLSGSGKGTQLQYIAHDLFEKGKFERVLLTREPSNTAAGRRARELREEHKRKGIPTSEHAIEYATLYAEDSGEHCRREIGPAIAQGIHVVCDRYTRYGGLTYQAREGVPIEKILELQRTHNIIIPDATFILDINPEVALARIDIAREERSALEKLEIMRDLRERYLGLAKLLPEEHIYFVDANQSPEQVFEKIEPYLDALWPLHR